MSVDFMTDIGYGYILTFDQIRALEEHTEGKVWDYACSIDGYLGGCNYFFGIRLCRLEPGEYVNIADITELSYEDAAKISNKIISMLQDCGLFPEHPNWNSPQIYILHHIT